MLKYTPQSNLWKKGVILGYSSRETEVIIGGAWGRHRNRQERHSDRSKKLAYNSSTHRRHREGGGQMGGGGTSLWFRNLSKFKNACLRANHFLYDQNGTVDAFMFQLTRGKKCGVFFRGQVLVSINYFYVYLLCKTCSRGNPGYHSALGNTVFSWIATH